MKISSARVNVTIITFNHAPYIRETLQSVIDQKTNFDFEILIGDDASTDETVSIIEEFVSKYPGVKYFQNKYNLGFAKTYSNLMAKCNAEYIAHIDGDDLMLPHKLQGQFDFLEAHPECSMCFHDMKILDERHHISFLNKKWKNEILTIDHLLKWNRFFAHSSKMFRRDAIPRDGFDSSLKVIGDVMWHMQNAEFGLIGYLHEPLGVYRMGIGILSSMKRDKAKIRSSIDDRLKALRYGFKRGGSLGAFSLGVVALWFSASRAFYRAGFYKDSVLTAWYIFQNK